MKIVTDVYTDGDSYDSALIELSKEDVADIMSKFELFSLLRRHNPDLWELVFDNELAKFGYVDEEQLTEKQLDSFESHMSVVVGDNVEIQEESTTVYLHIARDIVYWRGYASAGQTESMPLTKDFVRSLQHAEDTV